MKKVFSLMLLLATILTFTACGDDDEPKNNISKEQLIGIWDATTVQFNNDGKWLDTTNRPDLASSIYFYEDGTYYGYGALGNGDGTYTLSGNTIKTYVDGQLYGTYVVEFLVGNVAELTLAMGAETMGIRAKKSMVNLSASNDPSIFASYNNNSYWEYSTFDGEKLYRKEFRFESRVCSEYCVTYTIGNGPEFGNFIEIDGVEYLARIDENSLEYYQYSFDGKTLVLRNNDSKIETVHSANVNGNTLTISDNSGTIAYTKTQK